MLIEKSVKRRRNNITKVLMGNLANADGVSAEKLEKN